jgi:hypothetical protein
MDALCQHGQRLLGLNRHLADREECLICLLNFPLDGLEDDIRRLPGYRVRRFYLERHGQCGRIHFMDGTPTEIFFDLDRDEPEVLRWVGLAALRDGECQWFDLAAGSAEMPHERLPVGNLSESRPDGFRRPHAREAKTARAVGR